MKEHMLAIIFLGLLFLLYLAPLPDSFLMPDGSGDGLQTEEEQISIMRTANAQTTIEQDTTVHASAATTAHLVDY